MPHAKGAKAVVEALAHEGVKILFTIPGSHIFDIFDEFYGRTDFRLIYPKHEQSSSTMADVYGRLTGEPGVTLVTAGPGATNGLSGVAQAYQAGSPLVHISGTVARGSTPLEFHGVDDPDFLSKVFSPVAKMSVRVMRTEDIPRVFAQAFHVARSGRKGPVHIDLPADVLVEQAELEKYHRIAVEQKAVDDSLIREAAATLTRASRPVIYVGDAAAVCMKRETLLTLVERLQVPFVISDGALGFIPQDHPLYAGMASKHWDTHPVAESVLGEADALLSLGLRLGTPSADYLAQYAGGNHVHLYVEESPPSTSRVKSIVGDLDQAATRLTAELVTHPVAGAGWGELKERWRKADEALSKIVEDSSGKPIHPGLAVSLLKKYVEKGSIVTGDIGSNRVWTEAYLTTRVPCRYLGEGAWGAMGFALPATIGAKAVYPERRVVGVCGDGGFLMSCMELSTIAENKMDIVLIVLNDGKWGMNWQFQKLKYGGRLIGVDIHAPSFAKYAESFGLKGIRVEDPSELPTAYDKAFSSSKGTVVDVVTDHAQPYPFGKFP